MPENRFESVAGTKDATTGVSTRQRRGKIVRYWKTRVTVVTGVDKGLTLDVAGKPMRVGTAPDNDLVLSDPTVSRQHCEIDPTDSRIRVRDTNSMNGVFCAGMRLYDAIVNSGALLQLGDTQLSIQEIKEPVDREQAVASKYFDLIGDSPRMRELFADLQRIAPKDISLLIEGETGTGKELVAESVHAGSARAEGPFVVFDCSSVTASLAESELFGHERGAFTGAVAARPGVFEQAHGGTIFLDELGELPKDLQPKLLRVLESRSVRRLGSTKSIPVDVRVIAATNRNLQAEVRQGSFREDLYFRIAAAQVSVPPLRDRMGDLPMLVEHFLKLESPARCVTEIPASVWELFTSYRWPGNVRELRNAVQRFLVTPERLLSSFSQVRAELRKEATDEAPFSIHPLRIARRQAADQFELAYLRAVLEHTDGNVTRAASIAEVSRQMIQKLLRKHGLNSASL
ncbi:MAG: sigma 54-interacting transcriptional regulator [Polyangiaceae bacterium]